MLRGIAWVLGVLLVLGGGWWLYNRAVQREVPTNGDVFVRESPPDTSSSKATEDSSTPNATAPAKTTAPAQQAAPTDNTAAATTQSPAPQSTSIVKPSAALPVADTIAPNPPNGMVFAGSGKYQWYRQGNLTWRVNTENGSSCIAFATDEEWRKPRVLSHGCGHA